MGECLFWYRPTRVVPDQRPLNGRCCCCFCVLKIKHVTAGNTHPTFPVPNVLQQVMSIGNLPSVLQSLLQTPWILLKPCLDSTGRLHGMTLVYSTRYLTSPEHAVSTNMQALNDNGLFCMAALSWITIQYNIVCTAYI